MIIRTLGVPHASSSDDILINVCAKIAQSRALCMCLARKIRFECANILAEENHFAGAKLAGIIFP